MILKYTRIYFSYLYDYLKNYQLDVRYFNRIINFQPKHVNMLITYIIS